jgi:hypothetical protein
MALPGSRRCARGPGSPAASGSIHQHPALTFHQRRAQSSGAEPLSRVDVWHRRSRLRARATPQSDPRADHRSGPTRIYQVGGRLGDAQHSPALVDGVRVYHHDAERRRITVAAFGYPARLRVRTRTARSIPYHIPKPATHDDTSGGLDGSPCFLASSKAVVFYGIASYPSCLASLYLLAVIVSIHIDFRSISVAPLWPFSLVSSCSLVVTVHHLCLFVPQYEVRWLCIVYTFIHM